MKVRVFIFGSCVSRDILNYQNDEMELVGYFARSSFASAFSSLPIEDIYTKSLSSDFQRRIVSTDLNKSLEENIRSASFDLLLIDFIDERFNLFMFEHGGICTISNELRSTGFAPEREAGQVIPSGDDEFFELWESGWTRFLSVVDSIGCRGKVRVNRALWATTTSSGKGFPTYSANYILSANKFLERLYARAKNDLMGWQFIEPSASHFVAAEEHRWGLSPFHYIDAYYADALERILTSSDGEQKRAEEPGPDPKLNVSSEGDGSVGRYCEYPFDRSLISWQRFTASGHTRELKISGCRTRGNGVIEHGVQHSTIKFEAEGGTHQVAFVLPKEFLANGLAARVRLQGWNSIRYLAFGYTYQSGFRHIKVANPAQGQWLTISLVHGDIAYGIQNDWEHPPPANVSDVRIYLRAEPHQGKGAVEVEHFVCWQEVDRPAGKRTSSTLPVAPPPRGRVSPDLLSVLYGYLRRCFRHVDEQAEAFMQAGQCPLYGETQLAWQLDQLLPDGLATVGTYAFSWHALHPATILLVHGKNTGKDAPLFAAREMVTNWLDRSYYTPDPDKKYAWYDHGTAERQLAFILMWALGEERGFDQRFMSRLGGAMIRHAELLESELFYASHQPSRYHNHAWFQDLALMATALAMPALPTSRRWMQRAIERLTDQLETLIVRDNGFSVFVENSIGYHQGVQRIVELAGDMVRLAGVESAISEVAVELCRFADFFRYVDDRSPAQGDTFRRANSRGRRARHLKPYTEPEVVVLPKAGYGIVKGNHDAVPFMFSMFATSLCRTHKHEDDLSFTLFFDGIEWLIDPSFYSHEYKASVPAYLRSAAAHNSIFLVETAYSIDPGHASIEGAIDGGRFKFSGSHSAYSGVRIKRQVSGHSSALSLGFIDEVVPLEGAAFDARLMLHCGEGVDACREGPLVTLSHPDSEFELKVSLPTGQIRIEAGVTEGPSVRGISGTGFMKYGTVNTLECSIPCGVPVPWKIECLKRTAAHG